MCEIYVFFFHLPSHNFYIFKHEKICDSDYESSYFKELLYLDFSQKTCQQLIFLEWVRIGRIPFNHRFHFLTPNFFPIVLFVFFI